MKRVFVFAAIVIGFSVAGAKAQGKDAALLVTQESVKKVLIKHTTNVYKVSFDQCRASIKISGPTSTQAVYQESGRSYVGGGFPHDDASNYLSAGSSGDFGGWRTTDRYEIDLSKLGGQNISVAPAYRKGFSRISLVNTKEQNAVGIKHHDRLDSAAELVFIVKTKNIDKTVKALHEILNLCENQKH